MEKMVITQKDQNDQWTVELLPKTSADNVYMSVLQDIMTLEEWQATFGLSTVLNNSIGDCNVFLPTGFFRTTGDTLNRPPNSGSTGAILNITRHSSATVAHGWQVYFASNGKLFWRSATNAYDNTWLAWTEIPSAEDVATLLQSTETNIINYVENRFTNNGVAEFKYDPDINAMCLFVYD